MPAVILNGLAALRMTGRMGLVGIQQGPVAIDGTALIGKTLTSILEGGADPHVVIPQLIELWQAGRFPFDRLIETFPLSEINEAEQASKAGLVNAPGTIAMARTSDPHSASAQFFINVADNKFLNYRESTVQGYGYTVFGKVVQGMDVVEKIAKAPTGAGGPFPKDVPVEKVLITSAKVVDAK